MFFHGARKKNSKIYLLISIYLFTYNVGSAIFGRVTVTVHATNYCGAILNSPYANEK